MQAVQQDTLDVQVRESLPAMLACVQEGLLSLSEEQKSTISFPLSKLKTWDYQYKVESVEASIFEAWELMIATYMHESKIDDIRLRRSIWAIDQAQMFLYKQIVEWAENPRTKQDYCSVLELGSENTC